jgi:hypothetical protein
VPVAELALNQQIALAAVGGVDNQIGVVAGAGFAMFAVPIRVPKSARIK